MKILTSILIAATMAVASCSATAPATAQTTPSCPETQREQMILDYAREAPDARLIIIEGAEQLAAIERALRANTGGAAGLEVGTTRVYLVHIGGGQGFILEVNAEGCIVWEGGPGDYNAFKTFLEKAILGVEA